MKKLINFIKTVLSGAIIFLVLADIEHVKAQGICIADTIATPDPSAKLELRSNNKGLLLPRLTTTQRDVISLPKGGLIVYNTDSKALEFYNGTMWRKLF